MKINKEDSQIIKEEEELEPGELQLEDMVDEKKKFKKI